MYPRSPRLEEPKANSLQTFTIHKTVRTMPLNGIGERVFNVVLSSRNHAAKELPKIQQAKSVYKG